MYPSGPAPSHRASISPEFTGLLPLLVDIILSLSLTIIRSFHCFPLHAKIWSIRGSIQFLYESPDICRRAQGKWKHNRQPDILAQSAICVIHGEKGRLLA